MRIIALLLMILMPLASQASDIVVKEAYIPQMPPGSKVFAAYLVLSNPSERERRIVGVRAKEFSMVHLHMSVVDSNGSSMQALTGITLAPGETVAMEPGGMHIMLMSPAAQALSAGVVNLVLEFKDGAALPVEARIREAS